MHLTGRRSRMPQRSGMVSGSVAADVTGSFQIRKTIER
jgi:hypothetical protein